MTLLIITSIILVLSAVVIILTPMKKPPELTVAPKPKITKEQKEAFEVFKILLASGKEVEFAKAICKQMSNNTYGIKIGEHDWIVKELSLENFINDWYKNN